MGDMSVTKRILLYIEENLDKELSLEKIAKEFSYSQFYIARIFKNTMGVTLYKYVQGRRLEEAARQLTETNRPIVEIAFEAGYSSQQAFTHAFRCTYTCTPQQYRRTGTFIPKQSRMHMSKGMKGMKCAVLSFELTGGRIAV